MYGGKDYPPAQVNANWYQVVLVSAGKFPLGRPGAPELAAEGFGVFRQSFADLKKRAPTTPSIAAYQFSAVILSVAKDPRICFCSCSCRCRCCCLFSVVILERSEGSLYLSLSLSLLCRCSCLCSCSCHCSCPFFVVILNAAKDPPVFDVAVENSPRP
jgi:hypothetical protein